MRGPLLRSVLSFIQPDLNCQLKTFNWFYSHNVPLFFNHEKENKIKQLGETWIFTSLKANPLGSTWSWIFSFKRNIDNCSFNFRIFQNGRKIKNNIRCILSPLLIHIQSSEIMSEKFTKYSCYIMIIINSGMYFRCGMETETNSPMWDWIVHIHCVDQRMALNLWSSYLHLLSAMIIGMCSDVLIRNVCVCVCVS